MKLPRLTKILPTLMVITAMIFAQTALPAAAVACTGGNSSSAQAVLSGVGGSGNCSDTASGVTGTISTAVTILSFVVGVAAIIMIVVAGFKYITSNGSSEKIGSAKNTLIYALVGLAIAALAQLLVHFVLTQSDVASNPCPTNTSIAADDKNCKT